MMEMTWYIPANFFWVKGVRFLTREYQDFRRRHEHIRRFPKTSEDVQRRSEQFWSSIKSKWFHVPLLNLALWKFEISVSAIRYSFTYSITWSFRFSNWCRLHLLGKCFNSSCYGSHFSSRRENLVRKRELAWEWSFQIAGVRLRCESWQV